MRRLHIGRHCDEDAVFDKEIEIDSGHLVPVVTWGTNPGQGCRITDPIPCPEDCENANEAEAIRAALNYEGLTGGQSMLGVKIDYVFIGSDVSKISGKRPRFSKVDMLPPTSRLWRFQDPWASRPKPKQRGLIRFSKRLVFNGVCPVAPCALE